MTRGRLPAKAARLWKPGREPTGPGPVHVSMNDYWVHRRRDVPRVAWTGMRLRRAWPATEGAIGLWFAAANLGHRQVSISIWRSAEDLKRFVRSTEHRRVMQDFRDAGALFTAAWTADRFDRDLIWRQGADRLAGRVAGVPHH